MSDTEYPPFVKVMMPDPRDKDGWVDVGRFMPRTEVGHYQFQIEHPDEALLRENMHTLTIRLEPAAQSATKGASGAGNFLGALCTLLGLVMLSGWPDNAAIAAFMFATALLVTPASVAWIGRKTGLSLGVWMRTALISLLFIGSVFAHAAISPPEGVTERVEEPVAPFG